jgi:hypothetical protein
MFTHTHTRYGGRDDISAEESKGERVLSAVCISIAIIIVIKSNGSIFFVRTNVSLMIFLNQVSWPALSNLSCVDLNMHDDDKAKGGRVARSLSPRYSQLDINMLFMKIAFLSS